MLQERVIRDGCWTRPNIEFVDPEDERRGEQDNQG
jgi:hypothetical protein